MKTREFFLMLLIIAGGVLLFHYETGEIENWTLTWRWDWDGPFIHTGKAFTFEEAGELPPPFSGDLEVVNEHGSVEIQGGPADKLAVTLAKKVWRRKEEDARRTAGDLNLIIKDDGGKVIVTAGRPDAGPRNYETHFTLTVPEGMNVTVRNSYGRVKTVRTGGTVVFNSHGAVEAREVGGAFSSDNSYEDVEVMDIAADCSIRSRHAGVTASRVQGRLRIDHSYGPVRLEDAAGDVTVNASHSRVTGLRLRGTVKVESSYNPVSLTDVGPALIKNRHSNVSLEGVRGDVDISNTYGRTEIRDVTGKVSILGRNMAVRGEGLTSSEINITTSYSGIDLRNFCGRTTISQKHAAVRLEPSSLIGDLRVEAAYSPVDLFWPASSRSPVECRTRNGKINWRLAAAPSLNTSNGHSLLRAFPEEEGRPSVSLTTSYADITVRQGAPAARRER